MRLTRWKVLSVAALAFAACERPGGGPGDSAPVTAANHRWFPITAGATHAYGKAVGTDGVITCDACHRPTAATFTAVRCDTCHRHPQRITERLHLADRAGFAVDVGTETDPDVLADLRGASCYRCHPTGEPVPFSHTGIAGACAECHDVDTPFAALPRAGFTHAAVGSTDCGGCHVTSSWLGAGIAPNDASDPARSVTVTGLVPSFTDTTIVRVTPLEQQLAMRMNHLTATIDAGVLADCGLCHEGAIAGSYYPGSLHSALANLGEPQPRTCGDCHDAVAAPRGFVGPLATAPARTPATGEMRHEAVAWDAGVATSEALVKGDCSQCHRAPGPMLAATWSVDRAGTGAATYHAALTAAGQPQPGACLDCHANSRPAGTLTSATAALPAGLAFDHDAALGECVACHASTTTWTGGRFHLAGSPRPTRCLPCHEAERPTSTTGWTSTTYQRSPFDYGGNDAGIGHGGNEDCAVCHGGTTQSWLGGTFPHGPGTLAAVTCGACHVSQRPAAVVQAFDHTLNGAGDCRGCHQATVTAGRYVDYFNPATMALPGGDWQGGLAYPGDILTTSTTQFISLPTLILQRTASGLVTGSTAQTVTLFNGMLHSSTAIPPALDPGTTSAPNNASCWHCHTHTNGVVTAFSNGTFHQALDTYAATPGGTVAPLAQPTTKCIDCHERMRPDHVVLKAGAALVPMDHAATFTAPATIAGQTVTTVANLDCSACHADPGGVWSDGRYHAVIGSAVPSDCVTCHYPLMATAQADVTSGTTFVMKHRSTTLTIQRCETCHAAALANSRTPPPAVTQWRTGALHPKVPQQPGACLDCHAISEPAQATQGSVTYALTMGGTATNGGQWMSHTVSDVTSRDCGACHLADAKTSGSAWSKATAFHAKVSAPSGCATCHGTTNGRGTVPGTNNNLPSGLTSTRTTTTASNAPGVKDQMLHTDVNVTARDCGVCHTQKGPSTVTGVQGQEWKVAQFHRVITAGSPLVMNNTSGRCSNCHLNVKPGATFAAFDHAAFVGTSGTPDCSTCHGWPGTSSTTPNWLGAAAMPAFISVGGFVIPRPPAATANLLQPGIANLPHPPVATGEACTVCHGQASGGRQAKGYPHTSSLIASKCNACHEAGSDLVGTPWNGSTTRSGAGGDTRPLTLTTLVVSFKGNSFNCSFPTHFYPTDCKECHRGPTSGYGFVTTGTAYFTAWRFVHAESAPMTKPATCDRCHTATNGGCGIRK